METPADLSEVESLKKRLEASEARERAACDVLRSLACWLGVGGYNAPTVDTAEFERKIRDGVDALIRVETERARGPQISDSEQVLLLRRTIKASEARERTLREALEKIVTIRNGSHPAKSMGKCAEMYTSARIALAATEKPA